jgi:SpoVK/Ycf46/Vps4 family AAA+-type ATPase
MVDAHPIDASLAFVEECKSVLKTDELRLLSYPMHGLMGVTQADPRVDLFPLSVNTKGPVVRLATVDLPFGRVGFIRDEGMANIILMPKELKDGSKPDTSDVAVDKEQKFAAFCERITKRALDNSIYKGKILSSDWTFLSWDKPPVIFSGKTMRELEANLLYPIRNKGKWEELGLGNKRSIMLAGTYGTGKTTVARWVADEATKHGWTFMAVRTAHMEQLPRIIRVMRLFKPVVLFIEDVDSITMEEDEMGRGLFVNMILNVLDGVECDTNDMLFLLTSNFAERITPALKRPGRTDCIIKLDLPDPDTAMEAFRFYSNGDEVDKTVLTKMSFSEIKEITIRARLLARSRGVDKPVEVDYTQAADQIRKVKQLMESGIRYIGFNRPKAEREEEYPPLHEGGAGFHIDEVIPVD